MLQNIDAPARSTEVSSELHARELLGALPVAVYTTDAAGLVTAYNDAAVALWGARHDALVRIRAPVSSGRKADGA